MKFAVIDIGSNTIKLNIYRKRGGRFEETDSYVERTALASYKASGILSDQGVTVLINVILALDGICRKKRVKYVFPYATQSLRDITNADEVLSRIKSETGLDVEIISGEEEARLGFESFVSEFGTDRSGLLADMGGGSTELTVFDGGAVRSTVSLPFGSLSIAKDTCSGIIPDTEAVLRIEKAVGDAFAAAGFCERRKTLYVTGGTASGAFRLCREYGLGGKKKIAAGDLKKLISTVQSDPEKAERKVRGLLPDRYDSVYAGIAAYTAICEKAGVETVVRSKTTCRRGYAAMIFETRLKK